MDVFWVILAGAGVDRFEVLYYFCNGGFHNRYVGLPNEAVIGFVQHDKKFGLAHLQGPSHFL